jgi:polyferredoxin
MAPRSPKAVRPAGPHARLPRWRWLVQGGFLALTALIAWEFTVFFRQVMAGGPVTAHRPPGVEAYLPIGALLGIRRWLETGFWDELHPAGMTFLLAVAGGAVLARRAFCAWICPFGTFFRALERLRPLLRLPERWNAPRWARWCLEALKYLVLGWIVWTFASMPVEAVNAFMYLPYNLAADANMLLYVATLGATGALVIGAIALVSTVVRNAWCRFLCPYGALLGVAGAASPLPIVRDEDACKHCGACTRACGMGIEVARVRKVRSLECTSCMACVAACPHGALDVRGPRGLRVRPWVVPAIALGVLGAAWLVARAAGFWETSLGVEDFARAYELGLKAR